MATPCTTCTVSTRPLQTPSRRRFWGGLPQPISPMQSELFLDLPTELWNRWWHQRAKERQPFRGACLAKSPVRKKLIKRRLGRWPATWPGMRIDASHRGGAGRSHGCVWPGSNRRSGLHGIACHDAQGGSDFSAVSFYHPIHGDFSGAGDCAPGRSSTGLPVVVFTLGITTGRQIVDPCRPREAPPSQNAWNSDKETPQKPSC